MTERFVLGEGVRVWAHFTDPVTKLPADPTLPVTITIDPPPGSPMPASRTIQATRQQRGVFYADTPGDVVGVWTARGESSGPPAGHGADEVVFEVTPTRMR